MPTVIHDSPNLGNLLGQGIVALANHKVDKMHTAERVKNLQSVFPGMSYDQATFIDRQEPKLQQQYLQQLQPQVQQQEATPQAQQIQPQQQVSQMPAAYQDPKNLTAALEYLKSPQAQQELTPDEIRLGNQKFEKLLQDSQMQQQGQQLQQQPQAAPQVVQQQLAAGQTAPQRKPFLVPEKNTKEARLNEQLNLSKEKFQTQQENIAREEGKSLREKKKGAKEAIRNLDRFDELEKEGLPSAGEIAFYKNAGLDIPALIGAPAEEYEKIAATFIKGAKAHFGARLTDNDLNLFLKTVPSLSNSPGGRKRINAQLRQIAQLEIAEADAFTEIVKKNGGRIPIDLEDQLDAKLDNKRDAIYKQFKKNLTKEVPKGENALVTSILHGAGKLVGNIPKAAAGAATGAAAGAYRGGTILGLPGAVGGAVIGGGLGLLGAGLPTKFSVG